MAKYTVTHTCGHTETVQLFGAEKERKRRLDWMRGQDCAACKAAAVNRDNDLPALVGTDKQVAWAADIRRNFYAKYPALKTVVTETSAKWWIEARLDSLAEKHLEIIRRKEIAKNMTKADIFRRAHTITKALVAKYPGVNYQAQFAQSLKFAYEWVREALAA